MPLEELMEIFLRDISFAIMVFLGFALGRMRRKN